MGKSGDKAEMKPDDSVRDAGEPFAAADADVVLRSSDNVDFRAHRLYLKHASPIFADMFALPDPASGHGADQKDGLTVIRMAENESAVRTLLSFCYATVAPRLDTVDDLAAAIQIATKFDMQHARDLICSAMRAHAPRTPERVYALAWVLRSRELALLAAKESLKRPFLQAERLHMTFPEFRAMSAQSLQQLIAFQSRCVSKASQIRSDLEWLARNEISTRAVDRAQAGVCDKCPGTDVDVEGGRLCLKNWFLAYVAKVARGFRTRVDLDIIVAASAPYESALESPCSGCGTSADILFALNKFNAVLRTHIEQVVSESQDKLKTPF